MCGEPASRAGEISECHWCTWKKQLQRPCSKNWLQSHEKIRVEMQSREDQITDATRPLPFYNSAAMSLVAHVWPSHVCRLPGASRSPFLAISCPQAVMLPRLHSPPTLTL